MIKVLFVCLGNICRSPMADAIFQQMVKDAGLTQKIEVDSAGTGSWHVGEPPHHGTQKVLKQHNIPYNGRSRQIIQQDLKTYDYILTMDHSNLRNVLKMLDAPTQADGKAVIAGHEVIVRSFLSFANDAGTVQTTEVPDPYYDGRFDAVYTLVEKGCDALLEHIIQTHML